jgi:signal transduction histidine kinase/CheY-like chemotaxis protein
MGIGKNTPILKHIIVVQILSLGIAVSLSILCFLYFKKANIIDAYHNKIIENIRSTIEKRQKDWLIWKHFGLTEALERDIDIYLRRLPLKSIEIVKHPNSDYSKKGSIVVFSEELKRDFPYTIVAKLDFDGKNSIAGKKIGVLTIVAICLLFIFTSFYLVAFIKKFIFKPMLHLTEGFERLNRTGALTISDAGTKGEIKEFITGILTIYQKMKISEKQSAVTKTTQMLAHDVKKPFALLILILDLLQDCDDPEEIRKLSAEYIGRVQKSIKSVENMIEEILEVGQEDKIIQKPCSIGSILKSSLDEVSHAHQQADVALGYQFNHTHLVHVDSLKIQRVFSNIVDNALQAINNHDSIWFKTKESDDNLNITCCIGNTGSYIPKEDLPHVFDMFYSKNKHKGTGLGLAICHKIIAAHGCRIWCESTSEKKMVEFYFTLPTAYNEIDKKDTPLNSNIRDCIIRLNRKQSETTSKPPARIENPYRCNLKNQIKAFNVKQNRKLKLGIVDDELFYRHTLDQLIKDSSILYDSVDIVMLANRDDLFKALSSSHLDLLICDIDFKTDSYDGFEIVIELRKKGYLLPVCMHSDHSLPEDYENAMSIGAHALLPKPMSKEHLIQFIADTLPV